VSIRIALCACAITCALPALAAGQSHPDPAPDRAVAAARLSLAEAIRLAVDHNRQIAAAQAEVDRAGADLAAARTRRLPSFETTVVASQLLTPVDFSFPRGAFGDLPGVGPFPTAAAGRDIERERTRGQQLAVVNAVKRLYFAILQTQSALGASEEAIALFRELDRTLGVRVTQKVALRAEALDVQLRLTQEELTKMTRTNTLASQKEQLNQLLGRDVSTDFEVEDIAAITPIEVDLVAARGRALENRPDVREARLALARADLDRRVKKAERIPDVSLALAYSSNVNIDMLPRNLTTVGVQVTWEPFDWGRKRHELAAKSQVVVQARLGVRDVEDRAVLEINSRFRTLTEARAHLNVARLAEDTAREQLRVTTNRYQLQAALLSDVLQRRAAMADTTDRHQQARLAFWTAKADFEHAAGEDVIP
jgi:outer membrane protein